MPNDSNSYNETTLHNLCAVPTGVGRTVITLNNKTLEWGCGFEDEEDYKILA